jgi:hypothetical protein
MPTPKRTTLRYQPGLRVFNPHTGEVVPVRRFTHGNDGEDSIAPVHDLLVVKAKEGDGTLILRYNARIRRMCEGILADAKPWNNN